MKIRPIYDRLIVHVLTGSERTAGGLYIPEVAREDIVARAEVLEVGAGKPNALDGKPQSMVVAVGDVIVCPRNAIGIMPYDGYPDGSVGIIFEREVMGIAYDLERPTGLVSVGGDEIMAKPDAGSLLVTS